jgi:hypothetical protein
MENKKSFILYSDQRELFDHLPNDVAGELIKHIFSYVNDENPTTDNALVNVAFLSIKATLKRDLLKWQSQIKQRSEAGKKSALSRQRNSTSVNARTRKATDSVSVSVNVSDNDNEIKEVYRRFAHLCLSVYDFNKLAQTYTPKSIDSILDSIENYKGNTKYKSLYLTAKKWLEKDGKTITPKKETISL